MAPGISPRLRRMQWLAVGLCTFAIALNYIDRSTLAIGNLKIRESLGLTAAGIGALQSVWSITYAFAQLPMGLAVDRVGTRKLVGWALVLWSIAQAAGGVFSGFIALLLSRHGARRLRMPSLSRRGTLRVQLVPAEGPRTPDRRVHGRRRCGAPDRHAVDDGAAPSLRLAQHVRRDRRHRPAGRAGLVRAVPQSG